MIRLCFALFMLAVLSCNNQKENDEEEEETGFNYEVFSKRFREVTVPFNLSDSDLLKNKDTAAIRNPVFHQYIADSIKTKIFGKTKQIKLIPLVRFEVPKGEKYFVVKATGGRRTAALLLIFDKEEKYGAAFPFLVPDNDPATAQVSSVDKAYSVSRNVSRKTKDDVITEGKDVYVYNSAANQFTLIMTDLLDDQNQELINPIDTFPRRYQWAGDYLQGKKNIVSIRDGRRDNEFLFFIHFEKEQGECIGEIRGTALMTSSSTAAYRRGGDPCVLDFSFKGSSVTLREVEGCGSHRGVKCLFEGTFTKKKEAKPKKQPSTTKK